MCEFVRGFFFEFVCWSVCGSLCYPTFPPEPPITLVWLYGYLSVSTSWAFHLLGLRGLLVCGAFLVFWSLRTHLAFVCGDFPGFSFLRTFLAFRLQDLLELYYKSFGKSLRHIRRSCTPTYRFLVRLTFQWPVICLSNLDSRFFLPV